MQISNISAPHNHILLAKIKESGNSETIEKFAKTNSIDRTLLLKLLKLQVKPNETLKIADVCEALCTLFKCSILELFPFELYGMKHPSNDFFSKLLGRDVNLPHDFLEHIFFKEKIRSILKDLSYRERVFIQLLFGLEDGYPFSHKEIGKLFKITKDEVSSTEEKAFHKLRHPARYYKLQRLLIGDIEKLKLLSSSFLNPVLTFSTNSDCCMIEFHKKNFFGKQVKIVLHNVHDEQVVEFAQNGMAVIPKTKMANIELRIE